VNPAIPFELGAHGFLDVFVAHACTSGTPRVQLAILSDTRH
jgi:hypothetical protein